MTSPNILIIDDEKDIRRLMEEIFAEEGYQITTASNGAQGRKQWQTHHPDVVFLDVWMPDMDGITLLQEMKAHTDTAQSSVVMMSGHGTIETAIQATKLGAYDFLEKPLSLAKLLVTAERALEHKRLHEENHQLKQKARPHFLPIGKSKAMQQLRDTIKRVAQYTTPLYVYGERGVGKHHLAEAVHFSSPHANHRIQFFQARDLNALCLEKDPQAVSEQLQSLTKGTLVIADIEQLSADCQQVIEETLFSNDTPPQTRLIALSHQPLEQFLQTPHLRKHFAQRLSVMPIEIPPLRQHTEDIPELIEHFVNQLVTQEGLDYRDFAVSAQNRLRQHAWPGNLREMHNVIQRLLILGKGQRVDEQEVMAMLHPIEETAPALPTIDTQLPLKQVKENIERAYLIQLLRETASNITETAKRSGVDRTNLYRKLKALNIDPKNP